MSAETAIVLINIILLLYIVLDAFISCRRILRWKKMYEIERERAKLWKQQAELQEKVIREAIERRASRQQ